MNVGLDIGLMYDDVNKIRRRASEIVGVNVDRIIVACTHNHEGPDTIGLWGPDELMSGVDEDYMTFLTESTLVELFGFLRGVASGSVQVTP